MNKETFNKTGFYASQKFKFSEEVKNKEFSIFSADFEKHTIQLCSDVDDIIIDLPCEFLEEIKKDV